MNTTPDHRQAVVPGDCAARRPGLRRFLRRSSALAAVLGLAALPASPQQCAFFPGCTAVQVNPGVMDVGLRCAEGERIELLDDAVEVSSACGPDAACVTPVQVRLFARCVGGVWNTGIDVSY